MNSPAIAVRPLEASDEAEWRQLWREYLAFYNTTVAEAVFAATFKRLLSGAPGEFRGLVAQAEGRHVGIAHFLFHRHCWRIEDVCYLQDLYTAPAARGRGVAKALIAAVYAAADAAGAPAVYWLTQEDNAKARALYDRVGRVTPFIRYNRA